MKRLAAILLSLLVVGCGASPAPEPPAPLPETQWAAPAPGMSWVAGRWHWDAEHPVRGEPGAPPSGDWVWVPGHWE